MVLIVHGRTNSGVLSEDGVFDPDMREALANAAQRYGLTVSLPSVVTLQDNRINIDTAESIPADRLLKVAALSEGELPCRRLAMERCRAWMDRKVEARGERTGLSLVRQRRQLRRGISERRSGRGAGAV